MIAAIGRNGQMQSIVDAGFLKVARPYVFPLNRLRLDRGEQPQNQAWSGS